MKRPVTKQTVAALAATLECIRRNKDCTVDFLRFEIRDEPFSRSRAQDFIIELWRQGRVIRHKNKSIGHGSEPDTYSFNEGPIVIQYEDEVAKITRPKYIRDGKTKVQADHRHVRRVKAVQMGMVRDPMVAALFGSAGV